jgi:phospho-2-dehydro-3-deoxyheptonate aldolase
MEWSAAPGGLAYSAPAQPLAWLDMLATSLRQFLVEKTILAAEPAELTAASLERAAALAGSGEAASLAWLSVRARAAKLGTAPAQGPLVSSRSSGRRRPSLPELRPRAKLIHARMHPPISDLRIRAQHPLVAPVVLERELPVNDAGAEFIGRARRDIAAVMTGSDDRLLVVVGPCSIHDPDAALDFAGRLRDAAGLYPAELVIAMRVYFEKPRTVTGWKGLINDPARDGSYQIDRGLRLARKLLADITALELPVATEFLDTTLGQYYADLVSWGAIGARTVESQVHRELASGLSMPVGFKNRTDGDFQVAIDAIRAARAPHWFPSLNREGSPAILATLGNEHTHLVLRGGTRVRISPGNTSRTRPRF